MKDSNSTADIPFAYESPELPLPVGTPVVYKDRHLTYPRLRFAGYTGNGTSLLELYDLRGQQALNIWTEVPTNLVTPVNLAPLEVRLYNHKPIARFPTIATKPTPKIVCLCGSTRFSDAFREANLRETLAGNIVLTIGCDMRSDADIFADKTPEELADIKSKLDELHLRKIDLADEVLILNVDGYIGESTRRELAYAHRHSKSIRFLEPITPEQLSQLVPT